MIDIYARTRECVRALCIFSGTARIVVLLYSKLVFSSFWLSLLLPFDFLPSLPQSRFRMTPGLGDAIGGGPIVEA